jgi:hypothetical protein
MAMMMGEKPQKIEDLRWKNRIVLYFPGKSGTFPKLSHELEEGVRERKIVYFVFDEILNSNSQVDFSNAYISEIRKKFGASCEEACWVLIGLDGGVKLRKEGELDWGYIFKTIDSMPMRRSEIGSKT